MSRKTGIAALAAIVAAVGTMSVAAAPASAGNFQPTLYYWVVAGSLTAKKLNQQVTLPAGSTILGTADLQLEGLEKINGTLKAKIFVPPFKSTLTILGVPTPVAVEITFNQNREAEGTVNSIPPSNCGGREGCLALRVPTQATIGLTGAFALGLRIPTHCQTSEPITLALSENLTFLELIGEPGPRFQGTATIPSITCGGLEGLVLGPVLTAALSGPENPYAISISPPPVPKK
jgi:hypothetical protein